MEIWSLVKQKLWNYIWIFYIKFKDNEKYMEYEYEHSKQYFIYSGTDGF